MRGAEVEELPQLADLGLAARPAVAAVCGALLLAFGRRLFWLFVGVVGFAVGFRLAGAYLGDGGAGLLVALAAGALAALAAVLVQKLAVTLAGFAAGAVGLLWLGEQLGWPPGAALLAGALAAGVVAAVLVRGLFEVGLIVLSSLAGAALLVEAWRPEAAGLALPLLAAAGVVLQLVGLRRGRRQHGERR